MSMEKFENNCDGCKPVLFNPITRTKIPDESPTMQEVFKMWNELTIPEREAWHRVTCQNSRAEEDMRISQNFVKKIEYALSQMDPE